MSMHHVCAWYPQGPEEGTGSPETGVIGCESPDKGLGTAPTSARATVLLTAD